MGLFADSVRKALVTKAPQLLQTLREIRGDPKSATREKAALGLLRKIMTPDQITAALENPHSHIIIRFIEAADGRKATRAEVDEKAKEDEAFRLFMDRLLSS